MIERFVKWLSYLCRWEAEAPRPIPEAPKLAPKPPLPVIPIPMETLDWTTQKGVYHAVRVTCDNAGLTLDEKNIITACIFQESAMKNSAVCKNRGADGAVWSTDWGIAQINDWFHIGSGKDFPTVAYVLSNPQKVVEWMIKMYRKGQLKQWVSFSSGAYKHWLLLNSPMWKLK